MAEGLRTTIVGSWWPLEGYEAKLRQMHRGEMSEAESEALLRECAQLAIDEQRELGLTEWTGGEYFTDDFLMQMQKVLSGVEIDVPAKSNLFDYDDMGHARITGTISAPNGMGYLQGYLREKDLTGGVKKASVVGPMEMAFNAFDQLDELKRQLPNMIKTVNTEVRGLAAAGCPTVQLDVPTFASMMSMGAMTADEAAEIIVACFEGAEGVRKGIHICSGNLRGRPLAGDLHATPWVDILERLDGIIDVAHLALQYFIRYLERDVFARIPRSIELAAGIVDEGSYWVESVEKIRERARDWAQVVGEERLWLAPSCGFGRHPARDIPVLREKVANMVEAAATL